MENLDITDQLWDSFRPAAPLMLTESYHRDYSKCSITMHGQGLSVEKMEYIWRASPVFVFHSEISFVDTWRYVSCGQECLSFHIAHHIVRAAISINKKHTKQKTFRRLWQYVNGLTSRIWKQEEMCTFV